MPNQCIRDFHEAPSPYANLRIDAKDEEDVKSRLDNMDKMCAAVAMFASVF